MRLLSLLDLCVRPKLAPMKYLTHRPGKAVSVCVSDNGMHLNNLLVHFERKIGAEDVANGVLIPVTRETIKRPGTKRVTSIALSYETAEDLHKTLGRALKDARLRHFRYKILKRIEDFIYIQKHIASLLDHRLR